MRAGVAASGYVPVGGTARSYQTAGSGPPVARRHGFSFDRRLRDDRLPAGIRAACKVVVPGAGHTANLEARAAFDAAVVAFLDGD